MDALSQLVEIAGPWIQMRKGEIGFQSLLQPFVDVQDYLNRFGVVLAQEVTVDLLRQLVFVAGAQEKTILAFFQLDKSYQTHHLLQNTHSLWLNKRKST
jgi:hypothetical protein